MLLNYYSNCSELVVDGCDSTPTQNGVCNMTMAGVARYLAFIGKFASSGLFITDFQLEKKNYRMKKILEKFRFHN